MNRRVKAVRYVALGPSEMTVFPPQTMVRLLMRDRYPALKQMPGAAVPVG